MDKQKIWKLIAKQLCLAKRSPKESDYQAAIYDIFTDEDFLGWPADRVVREFPIKMGSTKKSDIVLLDKNLIPFIAIEVKLTDSPSDGVEQLGSYMDRCNPRLKFGITVKDSINLYYDIDTGRSLHSADDSVLTAHLDDYSNTEGLSFVGLFHFADFRIDKLTDFCEAKGIDKQNEKIRNEKVRKVRDILKGEGKDTLIKNLLTQHFASIGIIDQGEEDIVNDAYMSNEPKKDDKSEKAFQKSCSRIEKIFIPSRSEFVECLNNGICYRHFVLDNGNVHTEEWRSGGGITEQTINGNITSTLFYRKNKNQITRIILSPYSDWKQK